MEIPSPNFGVVAIYKSQSTEQSSTHLWLILGQEVVVVRVTSSRRRLISKDIISPPWSTTPPEASLPDIRVGLQVIQQTLDSSLASWVCATSELSQDADLAICSQPVGSSNDTLNTDGGADTSGGCSGRVGVEVLMHFVDDLVQWVG